MEFADYNREIEVPGSKFAAGLVKHGHQLRTFSRQLAMGAVEEGLRAIAAPLRNGQGRVVAAVNLSAQAQRWSSERIRAELLPPLLRTVARIEEDLGGVQPAPSLRAAPH